MNYFKLYRVYVVSRSCGAEKIYYAKQHRNISDVRGYNERLLEQRT